MEMWNEKLTRENIEQFYDTYAAFAYRCAYKNLRDTTRAEIAVTDAFIDTYHKRAKLPEDKVIYYFSDALQYHVNELAGRYQVINDAAPAEKSLDEYTASTMKHTIMERIDSPRFRVAEFMASASDNKIRRNTPLADFFQNSGVTVMLLIKLVILAIVVGITTYFGAKMIFHADDFIQTRTQRGTFKLEEHIVGILDYIPVDGTVSVQDPAATDTPETDASQAPESSAETTPPEGSSEPSATQG